MIFQIIFLISIISLPTALAQTLFQQDLLTGVQSINLQQDNTKNSLTFLTNSQDILFADIQDLIQEQTHPSVLNNLRKTEALMAQAVERLVTNQDLPETIAIQTEIIEQIHKAAKQQQQESNKDKSKSSKALEDMLKKMQEKNKNKGNKPKDKSTPFGSSSNKKEDSQKTKSTFETTEENGKRKIVPRNNSGNAHGTAKEFQKSLQAYNRLIEKNIQSK